MVGLHSVLTVHCSIHICFCILWEPSQRATQWWGLDLLFWPAVFVFLFYLCLSSFSVYVSVVSYILRALPESNATIMAGWSFWPTVFVFELIFVFVFHVYICIYDLYFWERNATMMAEPIILTGWRLKWLRSALPAFALHLGHIWVVLFCICIISWIAFVSYVYSIFSSDIFVLYLYFIWDLFATLWPG